ncbi:MAG TPA: 50S ribosomal protein L11 methyltransferase [Egibacteraceae bacterium]|nr:50S ribosomal protein L11 methyltransferase [Egibacteraceae bacterium]
MNLHLRAIERAGLLGICEEDGRATVYVAERADPPPVAGVWEWVPDRDWGTAWRARIRPVTVGEITIGPPWLVSAADAVVIDPGQAFGTGSHDTTAACVEALQRCTIAGKRVLDVGTGSGVLAICAARLGASHVVALEIDPLAVQAALANARLNDAAIDVRHGSTDLVEDERFDVVVANLDTATIAAVASGLARALAPGATLIGSGISAQRSHEAVTALHDTGLAADVGHRGEWCVLVAAEAAPEG